MAKTKSYVEANASPPPLGLFMVMGSDFKEKMAQGEDGEYAAVHEDGPAAGRATRLAGSQLSVREVGDVR